MKHTFLMITLLLLSFNTTHCGSQTALSNNKVDNDQIAKEYVQKGNLLYEKGKYDRAVQYYSKAIELKPDYYQAHYNRMYLWFEKDTFDKSKIKSVKDRINNMSSLHSKNVGPYAKPGEFYMTYKVIVKYFDKNDFIMLSKSNNPYARLMGIACLAKTDLDNNLSIIKSHLNDNTIIESRIGCFPEKRSISNFVKEFIDNPNFLESY